MHESNETTEIESIVKFTSPFSVETNPFAAAEMSFDWEEKSHYWKLHHESFSFSRKPEDFERPLKTSGAIIDFISEGDDWPYWIEMSRARFEKTKPRRKTYARSSKRHRPKLSVRQKRLIEESEKRLKHCAECGAIFTTWELFYIHMEQYHPDKCDYDENGEWSR